jgi:catechol 2,3-dioxygenase-like lactoylglutathione lyase family enzyme
MKPISTKMPQTNINQANINTSKNINTNKQERNNMKVGAFSVSLNVKDINASKQFYETLGFTALAGDINQNYLIMKNENALVGLFQGMFEGNILTFNPGWDQNAQNMDEFEDIRQIQRHLKAKGIQLTTEADENTSGPASLMLADPDGNVILIDQHR